MTAATEACDPNGGRCGQTLATGPTMSEQRIITNRVFLIALDEMYRSAVKRYERQEMLPPARELVDTLQINAADVPVTIIGQ